jgi:class 3 adenylate cyclase/tetratricopeptide (TPR) repeat protein
MIGKTVSHYKILEKLGEGGMGEVFLAEDSKLKRKVALKFLPLKMTSDRDARKRFEREAEAVAALNHPNIVTIHEIDEFNGQIYIALEYVEGETLKEKAPALTLKDTIDIAVQVCEGMEAAHGTGIVHRDIKLLNLILDKSNRVKILDFGLAKLKGSSQLTSPVSRIGTVYYMSPEQAMAEEPDLRTDIWSLGVVLYEMVTGELPFKGEHEMTVIYSIVNESPLPPSEIRAGLPKKLEKIIFKCLQKERKDRYSSMQQLLTELKKVREFLKEKEQAVVPTLWEEPGTDRESERRQATVLFAEISGLDEMQEKLGAEEAASMLNTCFERFAAIVEKYGGRIDKVIVNSLVAFFGVPTAIEDAPKQAVNAAIEMRNELHRSNREENPNIPLDIHIGIDTGIVIAGVIGKGKKSELTYNVTGNPVTLASHLKDLAEKGRIYAGPLTYKYTKNEFQYRELKPVTLKGKTKPAAVFKLLSTREKIHQPELTSGRMIYSEMVGRDKELDKLRLHVLKVINGEGSIISVIGEAGMGKSRLIAELKRIEDLEKVMLLEGRALSMGRNLSYHPIIDSLKNRAGIKEKDSEIESLSKLERTIGNIYPEGSAEIFPFVATLMGMKPRGKHAARVKGIEGEAMGKLILKNLRELLIKEVQRLPVVFIIHDIHWADISSIDLLESLFRLAEKYPLLFINVLRPNYPETAGRILETIEERYGKVHAKIYLEPLDETQCERLTRNLAKVSGLPADTMDIIAKRAEGNPFFIEEVVRSFFDEGVIEQLDGKFKFTGKIDSLVLPETIQGVLMARIDRLEATTRTLLKKASVIGRYFFSKILIEIAKTTGDIDERLEYLKGIQFIRERERLDEIEYLFKHALVQEVTYESILLKKRKELHLNVANTIESVFSGRLHEFYGMLALHYCKGENTEKAEEYLIRAGEAALKAAASNEALNYYQDALKLYLGNSGNAASPEKIGLLNRNIALAFFNKGHMNEAVEYFDKVLEYWGKRPSKNKMIALLKLVADLFRLMKNLYFPSKKSKKAPGQRDNEIINLTFKRGEALSVVDTNRMFMDTIGLSKELMKFDITKIENGAQLYIGGSIIFSFTGISFKISRKLLDYAKDHINKNDIKTALIYNCGAFIYNILSGNWDREFQHDEHLVEKNLNVGDLFWPATFLELWGTLELDRGNFKNINPVLEKLNEIGEAYDYDIARIKKYNMNTGLLCRCRKLHEALSAADAGSYYAKRTGQQEVPGIKPYIQILLADIKGAEKTLLQEKDAVSHEKRAAPLYLGRLLISQFLFDLYILEEFMLSDNNNKTKITGSRKNTYRSGKAAVKNSMKVATDRTEAFKLMGVYYWLIGKQKKALTWWHKSILTGQHLGARPELARTYMEVGKRMLEKKSKYLQWNGLQADEYLEKARALFEEMELDWDLKELAKVEKGEVSHD